MDRDFARVHGGGDEGAEARERRPRSASKRSTENEHTRSPPCRRISLRRNRRPRSADPWCPRARSETMRRVTKTYPRPRSPRRKTRPGAGSRERVRGLERVERRRRVAAEIQRPSSPVTSRSSSARTTTDAESLRRGSGGAGEEVAGEAKDGRRRDRRSRRRRPPSRTRSARARTGDRGARVSSRGQTIGEPRRAFRWRAEC